MARRRTRMTVAIGVLAAMVLMLSQWRFIAPHAGATQTPTRPSTSDSQWLTLVTGDRVLVRSAAGGLDIVRTVPGAGRTGVHFVREVTTGDTVLEPADALPLVAAHTVDRRLFDLTALARAGGNDLPLIVGYAGGGMVPAGRARLSDGGARTTRALSAVDGDAVRVPNSDTGRFWKTVAGTGGKLSSGLSRIWLDGRVHATVDHNVSQIGAPSAWQAGFTGKGVTVAVLDTGIDTDHPDLADAVSAAQDFTGSASGTEDRFGHGTHVAGIITGNGSASGGEHVGVAPDVRLLNGKVLDDDGEGTDSQVIAGMQWAVAQGARVVNLSLGEGPGDGTSPLDQALNQLSRESGTLFVVAAGNDGPGKSTVDSPGDADAALTVGAVDGDDALADFSSRGPRPGDLAIKPDITAPGVDIVSTLADGSVIAQPEPPVDGRYVSLSGTSMATPHVAGSAAILAGEHPTWKAPQLKAALMGSAAPNNTLTVYQQGAGRVDVARAVSQAVYATPASINDSTAQWPHTDDPPITSTVTYHNDGTTPLTLTLTAEVRDPHGQPAPAAMFTVDSPTVTVPAQGSTSVHLTVDTRVTAPDGTYGGVLTATDGHTVIRTPVGVTREVKSHTVTISILDRAGSPTGDYFLRLVNVDSPGVVVPYDASGRVVTRVPDGTYRLDADINTADPASPWGADLSVATEPQVVIDADRILTLDARTARPIAFTLDRPEARNADAEVNLIRTINWGGGETGEELAGPLNGLFLMPSTTLAPAGAFTATVDASYARPDRNGAFAGSPYLYHLWHTWPDRVPANLAVTVHDRDLAAVHTHLAIEPPDRYVLKDGVVALTAPADLIDYYTPRTTWSSALEEGSDSDHIDTVQLSLDRTYVQGERTTETWNHAVFGPAFPDIPAALANQNAPLSRIGDAIRILGVPLHSDQAANHYGFDDTGTQVWTLSRDGRQLGQLTYTNGDGGDSIPVPADTGTYQLSVTATRAVPGLSTVVSAEWTFTSGHPPTDDEQVIPAIAVRFAPTLDDNNQAKAGQPATVPIWIQQNPGTTYGQLTTMTVQVSYDDGKTWTPATVTGTGLFRTMLLAYPAGPGDVSLRATAADSAGNAVTQTIIHAYTLRP